jgi:hypothetical protein
VLSPTKCGVGVSVRKVTDAGRTGGRFSPYYHHVIARYEAIARRIFGYDGCSINRAFESKFFLRVFSARIKAFIFKIIKSKYRFQCWF